MARQVSKLKAMETFTFTSINGKNGALLNSRRFLIFGLAGIALGELAAMGRISFDGKRIIADTTSLTGDELLDDVLKVLAQKASACKTSLLIFSISRKVKRFAKRMLERLEDNGFIRIEQSRFLGLIPYDRYFVSRVREHEKLVRELKDIVLKGDKSPEQQKALLITMLHTCDVLRRLFEKEERKQVRNTLRKIGKAEFFETLNDFDKDLHKAVKAIITAARAAAS